MRIGQAVGVGLGAMAALAVATWVAVKVLVDPNDYKPRIAAAVRDATGRELDLKGDLKLAVFPWVALELGPASLGNPPSFGTGSQFLSFDHASVRVRLLPLLAKRLEVGRVEIDGLKVNLVRDAEGQGNWQGFEHATNAVPPAAAPPASPMRHGGAVLESIAGIKLNHARVTYAGIVLDDIDVETGSFAERGEVPVTLHLDAGRGRPDEKLSLEARFVVRTDAAAERYAVQALNLNTVATLSGHLRTEHAGASIARIDLDLKQQTLRVPAFTLNADGLEVNGSLEGAQILDAPRATGTLAFAPLVVREWMARLGWAIPVTRDPKALSSVAATMQFAYGDHALKLDPLAATVDDTHLSGSIGIVNLDTHAVAFDLKVDHVDLDRYRAPPQQVATPPPAEPALAEPAAPLEANGTLAIGSLHVSPLDLTQVKVTLATRDRVMRFFPLTANLDGGTYQGDVTLDTRTPLPVLSLDEHLSGVAVGQLLAADTTQVRLTGRGTLDLKATGRGAGTDAILRTLDGHFALNVADGAVEGVDLAYQLGRAEALLGNRAAPGAPDTGRTAFAAFKMSAQITHGLATTRDLLISSSALTLTGQGTANLPTQALDVNLLAETSMKVSGAPVQLPVKVAGTLEHPEVRPDIEALAKGRLKQKVEEVLKNKLQGLFGKP